MCSFLLTGKGKEKEIDPNNNNNKRKSRLTPGETSRAVHLSPPAIRWRRTLLEIRKVRDFQDILLTSSQARGEIFSRLFHVRFEDTIRRAVREELHKLVPYLNLPPRLLPDQNVPAQYRLCLINSKVKSPTFTTDLVQDDKGDPIEVAIFDSYTGSIVSPDSFLSSVQVRITVLNAEFWKNKGDNWSRSEFNQSILREREGKGPLLTCGGTTFPLKNGRGTSGNFIFGDNSSWTKSGFRLGVSVEVEGQEKGYFNGERVQEGVSDPFRVKDHRGKASQKPDRLERNHKVQCLKKIGKDRASVLEKNGIKTVEDFLHRYHDNELELRKILGIKSDSDKGWRAMVKHAKQCVSEVHAPLYTTSHPQQVSHFLNPNSNEIHYPINNIANQVSPLEEEVMWMTKAQVQFGNSSGASFHRSERSVPLVTNGGPYFVGSGSSEPNPWENNIINQDDMSAWCGALSTICEISRINVSDEGISGKHLVEGQFPFPHEINHMTIEGGNILNVGFMQRTTGGGLPELEIPSSVSMEGLFANAESTPDNFCEKPSRNNSFDLGSCEALIQGFISSMSNSMNVGPFSPGRKVKISTLFKCITRLGVPRKRVRIVPPANETTVPAM